jgi:hypothetical protein
MTQTTDAALVERLRKRLAEASPQPWVYRPDQFDDWGWIRGTERDSDIGRYRPIVAKGMDSEVAEEQKATHREAKTDPFGPNALLITDAVNALPGILDTIEAQARRIEALEKRGAEAVIAYHIAICSPKSVVPDDSLYDPAMATTVEAALDAGLPIRAVFEPSDNGPDA